MTTLKNIGGSYVTAKRNLIINTYQNHSIEHGLDFHINSSVISPDSSTLFTTSGMQQYKSLYDDLNYTNTFTNIQQCLRINDLEEIGDGTHFLSFEMIGIFSFREWSLKKTIDFMYSFLQKINITPDYVTIHPDKFEEWKHLYDEYGLEIRLDHECIWSDGNIGGYCTEFYKNDVEIGNIVNTMGTCIDVGFGLERLLEVTDSLQTKTRLQILEDTCLLLLNNGIKVGNNKQGYILKKLITESIFEGTQLTNSDFIKIKENQKRAYETYLRKKDHKKFIDKDELFWLDTYGFNLNYIEKYEIIFNVLNGD
jgi:alanyl-tRNA synthetase